MTPLEMKGHVKSLFDATGVHIQVSSRLRAALRLRLSQQAAVLCPPLSPSRPSLTTGEGPLIGADRTRYPPTLTHRLSVLPYILRPNHLLSALGIWRQLAV